MIESLFLMCLILIIYIYIGYPICIFIFSKLVNKTIHKERNEISVSILISAFNEEKFIARTIRNKLEQDYSDFEVIVISDESTDDTDNIVKSFSDPRVKFIRQMPRQGKTAALNKAILQAKGNIIVFSDANSIYDSNVLKCLVSNFSDPQVGYVTGKMIYTNADSSLVGDGCDSYMRYENWIRTYETQFNSVVGVDGGIDAMLRELYEPLNADQLPDFVQPLHVIKKGYRVIYEPAALLHEEALTEQKTEFKMRVRVSLRALWALMDMRALLNPVKYLVYSWQLFSHKVLRYLAWIPLVILVILNLLLLGEGQFYRFMLVLQGLFYFLAALGYALRHRRFNPVFITAPYYFLLVNFAAARAFQHFIRGKKQIMWEPRAG